MHIPIAVHLWGLPRLTHNRIEADGDQCAVSCLRLSDADDAHKTTLDIFLRPDKEFTFIASLIADLEKIRDAALNRILEMPVPDAPVEDVVETGPAECSGYGTPLARQADGGWGCCNARCKASYVEEANP